MAQVLKETIKKNLKELKTQSKEKLLELRYQKFRSIGKFA
jgi:acetyl-CoA carboxylase alpha subunit